MRHPTSAGYFWISYVVIMVWIATLAFCGKARAAPDFAIGHPICKDGFCVAQRYDEWKRVNGELQIVKSQWVMYAVTHRIIRGHPLKPRREP